MSVNPITTEEFKTVLPVKMRKNVNQDLLDNINTTISDPEILNIFRENVLGFTSVLQQGRFKMDHYLNAVKYVSYKLLGDTNKAAWAKTFPNRYAHLMARNVPDTDIGSICAAFNKSKLVMLIYEQTLVPTHILNAPLYQKAINVQADLMLNAKSEKVRCDAASNLIMNLKPPETQKIELDIGMREDDTIKALRASTMELVRQQQEMIKQGSASVAGVASSKLISYESAEEGQIV